jgi:hypothetical protein
MKYFENEYEVHLSKIEASEIEIADISKKCEIDISNHIML